MAERTSRTHDFAIVGVGVIGGHPYGRDETLAKGRQSARVGGFVRPRRPRHD